jgi:hypothetical protein
MGKADKLCFAFVVDSLTQKLASMARERLFQGHLVSIERLQGFDNESHV